MALMFFCPRQAAGGFTSRGGSTKKSLEVFCVLVMVSAGVVALWLVVIFATPIVPRAWLASCLVLMARVWNCLAFMSRMLCLRWALYLRSMTPHAEAVGIKTYCIETALPQGRKALALFVVVGFAMCVCAWPPEASPGSGLKPVIRDQDFTIHYSRAQLCEDKWRPIQCCRFPCTQKRSEDHCPVGG